MNSICGILVVVVVLTMGFALGMCYADDRWQREAVKRGVAEYDSGTGAWRWKAEK